MAKHGIQAAPPVPLSSYTSTTADDDGTDTANNEASAPVAAAPTNAKRKSAVSTSWDEPANTLTVAFNNGERLVVKIDELADSIRARATAHGLSAKLIDAAALSRSTVTGKSATVAEKFASVREVYERLTDPVAPSWNAARGDGTNEGGSYLVRALVAMYPHKTREAIVRWLQGLTAAEKVAVQTRPNVMAKIAELRIASMAQVIDTDALLGGLTNE